MAFVLTFFEGLASFISPCILPLIPVFAAFFAADNRQGVWRRALAFVLGFSIVFIAMGVLVSALGALVVEYRRVLNVISGIVIVGFGLSFLGVVHLPFKGNRAIGGRGVFAALIFGMVFAVNLSPCIGAFLGVALATAATAGSASRGAVLLAAYSLGLGVPFFCSIIAIDRLNVIFGKIKTYYRFIVPLCGVILVAWGVWTAIAPLRSFDQAPSSATEVKVEGKVLGIASVEEFRRLVLKSSLPAVVDFWAPWCAPCRQLSPEFILLAQTMNAKASFFKVNVDEVPALAEEYGITGIPCVLRFDGGKLTANSLGFADAETLRKRLGL